jgi:hypothetical protein
MLAGSAGKQCGRQSVSSRMTYFCTIDPDMSQRFWMEGIGSRFPFKLENNEPSMELKLAAVDVLEF